MSNEQTKKYYGGPVDFVLLLHIDLPATQWRDTQGFHKII